jgi:hypothetical protein
MILDLLTNAKPGGVYRGKVRTAEWSELEQQYKYNYFHCNIDRLTRDDAREDARQLAVDIATENGLQIVHTNMKHSITAVEPGK